MKIAQIPALTLERFRQGTVIPALPLALTATRTLDVRHQRALIRYYLAAGAGGLAVGVHSTQFEIRNPEINLFAPVLTLAAETIDRATVVRKTPPMKIAGVCGKTAQAVHEATLARDLGYHACLLSLAALGEEEIPALIAHCRTVAAEMPIIGFYLQPAVGGRVLPYEFWRAFCDVENVLAIKVAAFNRYHTLEVVRAVCDAGREREITLYTGNDDNILVDLLTPFEIITDRGPVTVHMAGGLLGHWAVWTQTAVALLEEVQALRLTGVPFPQALLTRAMQITDCNAAFFDAAHGFAGCIPGIHEVLRRQGLLQGIWCLNPHEQLSPGQAAAIDRVHAAYPHLPDDTFVAAHRARWLAEDEISV